jgi:aminomethyltransferase
MDETTRPDEVGLAWLVDDDDPDRDFVGRAALAAAPPPARCRAAVALAAKGVPRAGCDVSVSGGITGTVTSGSFSPTLERGIALVRMDVPAASLAPAPAPATVRIRGREVDASLVKLPFVRGSTPRPPRSH